MIARSIILILSGVCLAAVPLTEDPPVAPPPKPGAVTGRIVSDAPVDSVAAVSRATGKEYPPAQFDAKTGRFAFRELPGEAVYDICVKIGPRTIEVMASVKAAVLAVEAGRTVMLDREQLLGKAEAAGIAVLGIKSDGPPAAS